MGGIAVHAIGAARRDDADGRPGVQHGAHLHRRGVGAQNMRRAVRLRRHIESVLHLARRMVGRDVQPGEVVVVEFHVRAFGDAKAQVGKDGDDFFQHLADGMDGAAVFRTRGQGDIELLGCKPCIQRRFTQFGLAGGNRRRHRITQAVELRPLQLALIRRQRTHGRQQGRHRALLAQGRHAHGFQRGFIGRAGNLRQDVGLKGGDVSHENLEEKLSPGRPGDRLRWFRA